MDIKHQCLICQRNILWQIFEEILKIDSKKCRGSNLSFKGKMEYLTHSSGAQPIEKTMKIHSLER